MNINKVKSYIGFAIKSNAIVYGVDGIREKKTPFVVYSSALADSSKQRCEALKEYGVSVYQITDEQMIEIMENPKVKAFGIKNKELANAIEQNLA